MTQFTPAGRVLPHELLDRFKREVASQGGLDRKILHQGRPAMTSGECGCIGGRTGGRMVRVMIRQAEQAMADGARI